MSTRARPSRWSREILARELWGEPRAAIGKRIRSEVTARPSWREIVGVTQDVL